MKIFNNDQIVNKLENDIYEFCNIYINNKK